MEKNKKSEIKIGKVHGDVIISQNQKGGVTSHGVIAERNKKLSIGKIFKILGAMAAVVAILTYFNFKPGKSKENNMKKDNKKELHIDNITGDVVISQNQTGGITARTVNNYNVSNIQRLLPIESHYNRLSQFSNIKIYLHWQADDNESVLFKNNIFQWLQNVGWQVTQSAGHSNDSSIQNVVLDINATLSDNSNIVMVTKVLENIFNENNIKSSIFKNPNNHLAENEMYIRIGAIQ